jgi:hypothetical protein
VTHEYQFPGTEYEPYFRYVLVDVPGSCVDAYLVIRQGVFGPNGGASRVRAQAYFVQVVDPDPRLAHTGTEFLLLKRSASDPSVYRVRVMPRRESSGCSCPGFTLTGGCKHVRCLTHLVHVVGWRVMYESAVA